MKKASRATKPNKAKVKKVFDEGKAGTLRSGSKEGPKVKHGSKQEIAIALSEGRKAARNKRLHGRRL